jgi:GrpB-like predicted nucleotidyltransferase (UPF0157 family)/RimJ/RimL family protein N-acetyltransferase
MNKVMIREPMSDDKAKFLEAMQDSKLLHHPWVIAPLTSEEYDEYIQRFQKPNQKSLLVCDETGNIAGVFNISEIVRGLFQNAYLGFYAVSKYTEKGYMSAGLKLVLDKVFKEMSLHRLEANIQPGNTSSIELVKNNGFRYEGFSPRYLKINNEWCGHEHWAMTVEDYIRNDADVLNKDHVDIVAYNPEWPGLANVEISKLRAVLPLNKVIDIQHVGSTAIPGTSAKPIIDIQIAVNSIQEMKMLIIPELQKLGYEYWLENPDPKKMFFVKGMPPFGEKRTHHVHVFEHDSDHWRNKIIFRNYLLSHPEVVEEYVTLKNNLAREYFHDREKYTDKKLGFVNKVLQLAKNI